MSSTDQAFIRAYGAPVRSPRTAASTPCATAISANEFANLPAETRTGPAMANSPDLAHCEPIWLLHAASIDVGLNSVVPAPHFIHKTATSAAVPSPARLPPQIPDEFARVALADEAVVDDRAARLDVAFGSLPKAPLSSFADREFDAPDRLAAKPMFEIDAVRWPTICHKLLAECGARFAKLADDLRQEAAEGRKVLAVSGLGRGEGRTTLALCLAKQLAEARIRVALIDADFASPNVANRLGINPEAGWETTLCGDQSVWEVMIEATNDHLSIMPLAAAHFADQMPRPAYGIAAVLAELAEHFDLVLIDAGPLAEGDAADWLLDPASGVQGVILAHDARRGEASRLAAACLQLAEAGVRQLGIAEMFGPQTTISEK